jgi:hypothetical protein
MHLYLTRSLRWPRQALYTLHQDQATIQLLASTAKQLSAAGTTVMTHCTYEAVYAPPKLTRTYREEHHKREQKSGQPCPFFESQNATQPSRGAGRPSSRSQAKPLSRSTSGSKKKAQPADNEEDVLSPRSSEDELDTFALAKSTSKKSTASRASSAPVKTPASRKSTRSGAPKVSVSRGTTGSEVEDEPEASGSEAGRRVSKTKRKGQARAKERIEAIQEEDEAPNEGAEEVEVEAMPSVPVKPKRGRPPGKKTAAARAKAKKEDAIVEESEEEKDVPPMKKPSHLRMQSRANVESESDAPMASSSKDSKARSGAKAKARSVVEVAVPPPPSKSSGKKVRSVVESGDELEEVQPPQKAAAVMTSQSNARAATKEYEDENMEAPEDDIPPDPLPLRTKEPAHEPPAPGPSRGQNRKSSSTSEDAGYATAENAMEVDIELTVEKYSSTSAKLSPPGRATPQPTSNQLSDSLLRGTSLETAPRPSSRQGSIRPLSRASSMRPTSSLARAPSRLGAEIVDISSSDEETVPLKKSVVGKKAPLSVQNERHARSKVESDVREAPQGSKAKISLPAESQPKVPSAVIIKKPEVELAFPSGSADHAVPQSTADVEMKDVETVDSHIKAEEPKAGSPADGAPFLRDDPATPPPRTPSLAPTDTEASQPKGKSVTSALPSFDEEMEMEARASPADNGNSSLPYVPFLSLLPLDKLPSLTEDECDMTLEQYIRREMEREQQKFKADAKRKIGLFKEKAAETRRIIESA